MGEQPFHTDGAHLTSVPDVVVMASGQPSSTPTRIWTPPQGTFASLFGSYVPSTDRLRNGVFLVTPGGRPSFLATALDEEGFRYDPLCMTPCDARAREVAAFLSNPKSEGDTFSWDRPNLVLLLRNRSVLHSRGIVESDDTDREIQRVAFDTAGQL